LEGLDGSEGSQGSKGSQGSNGSDGSVGSVGSDGSECSDTKTIVIHIRLIQESSVLKSQVQIQIVQMVHLALKDWMTQMVQKFRCLVGSEWSKGQISDYSEGQI